MKRTDIINQVIRLKKFRTYLEVGIFNPEGNFDEIGCPRKIGVDIAVSRPPNVLKVSSDEFFALVRKGDSLFLPPAGCWDCIFIDGDHRAEQARKDLHNALDFLALGGVILMHDCLPASVSAATPEYHPGGWSGEVYKVFLEVRAREDLSSFCINTDNGVGVVWKAPNEHRLEAYEANYDALRAHLDWMRLVEPKDFVKFLA